MHDLSQNNVGWSDNATAILTKVLQQHAQANQFTSRVV